MFQHHNSDQGAYSPLAYTAPPGPRGTEHFRCENGIFLLAIEWLKEGSGLSLDINTEGGALYLSSGTTGGGRSRSAYSAQGLNAYKASALESFRAVLQDMSYNLKKSAGILSLIDPYKAQAPSSLGAMLDFFKELGPVNYTTPEALGEHLKNLKHKVILFGTSAHYLALSPHAGVALPKGSLVFETGGLKTKDLDFDRESLHQHISKNLRIPLAHILSEYGMAELASQAYSARRKGSQKDLAFRFPHWVQTWITRGLGVLEKEGLGALVIHDRARIDIPWPIRTQDLVQLNADGSFFYRGRVPYSVLKGCALR